jgi:hypothetical protein
MPSGPDAKRRAAVCELEEALAAVRCVVRLLEAATRSDRERELVAVIVMELAQAEAALRRVGRLTAG